MQRSGVNRCNAVIVKRSRSDDEPVEPAEQDPPESGGSPFPETEALEIAPGGFDDANSVDDRSSVYDTAELPVVPGPEKRTAAAIGAPITDPEESHTTEVRRAADLAELVGLSKARYTRDEIRAKVDMGDTETDTATWWRAMGLVEVPDGTVAFNSDDLAMVRALKAVLADGDANEDHVLRLARLLGGSMSRISEAQVSVIEDVLTNLDLGVAMDTAGERSAALASEPAGALIEVFEQSMLYIWRRHLFASLGRWIGVDPDHDSQAVGFVDISGFSHMSKRLDSSVLAEVIERFESEAVDVVSTHGGRVVKFIGDEAFFVTADLPTSALVALEMVDRMRDGDPRVDVHGGIAYGPTVTIGGDVFGNTVNLAKRLTDVARKGKILMPKGDSELFEGRDDLTVRRVGRSFEFKGVGRTAAVSVSRKLAGNED
jgi:adenylate cyclase